LRSKRDEADKRKIDRAMVDREDLPTDRDVFNRSGKPSGLPRDEVGDEGGIVE
jgi:hypothetical protein